MKYLFACLLIISSAFIKADTFPINNVQVKIKKVEVWPSNTGAPRYMAYTDESLPGGCAKNNGFVIEAGPGAEAAYSTVLAAAISSKTIELYLVRCDYYVVADRVRLIP